MAISKELQEIYSNYNNQEMFYEAVQLSHPKFGTTTDLYPAPDLYPSPELLPNMQEYTTSVFLVKANENKYFNVDGNPTLFLAYPFSLVAPSVGDNNQDIQVVFSNITREIVDGINLASQDYTVPIKMRYFVFVDSSMDTQITPLEMNLNNISVNEKVINATAQRADLFKYKYPHGGTSIYNNRFKGLLL